MTYVADGEGLDELRVDDFFVRGRDRDDVVGGVQTVLSRVVQHLLVDGTEGPGGVGGSAKPSVVGV